MPDTQLSLAALIAALPDNTTGNISEQIIRNLVETFRVDYGELSISGTALTSIVTPGTFEKAAGTTVLTVSPVASGMSMPANNRLMSTAATTRLWLVICSTSLTTVAANKEVRLRLAKGGSTIATSEIQRKVGSGGDVGTGALFCLCSMAPTNYIELYVTNQTDNTDLTLETMNMIAIGLPA